MSPDSPRVPTPQQVRRALARAERGAALDLDEATVLLSARGDDLERLCAAAARVRDAGLAGAGRPGVMTYSPKVFIPVTRLCRDRCHYCTFVTDARAPRPRGRGAVPLPRRDPRDRPPGRRARLHRGAVHPRRPARGPLARGRGVAARARATTPRSPTSARWRSGCSRRPACCRTSTPASCRGRR